MRRKRFSFLAGWAAVALLALAGFAAFGNLGRPNSLQVQSEAARLSTGHASGAFAGVAFAQPASLVTGSPEVRSAPKPPEQTPTTSETDETEADDATDTTASLTGSGTIATGAGWLSEVQVRALVKLHFKPADVNRAIRVAWCESRFDPEATNLRTGGVGIFQHLPRYWEERAEKAGFKGASPTDPEASIAAAAWEVYEGGGWELFCKG